MALKSSLLALLLLLLPIVSYAKDLGTVGRVYAIAEQDALQEVEDRARRVDMNAVLSRVKPSHYRPEGLRAVPRAAKNAEFKVDLTYTLPNDIPDGKGGVLYPSGYTFNPLDYVSFSKTLVFIDGTDRTQISWFRTSRYNNDPSAMLLLTSGDLTAIERYTSRPAYYATEQILLRLQIRAVPSVVKQAGRLMSVRELRIAQKD